MRCKRNFRIRRLGVRVRLCYKAVSQETVGEGPEGERKVEPKPVTWDQDENFFLR